MYFWIIKPRVRGCTRLIWFIRSWKSNKYHFSPQDIDILVPLTYLEEKWEFLQHTMEQLGYRMVNLQEHEFIKNDIKIGFAFTEDLLEFAEMKIIQV